MIVKIGDVISEYSVRNKFDENIPVYSVTNEKGFCTGYFSKEVASKDKSTYKIVPRGYFAYNPSRINVGSVDWQKYEDRVIVSPLYVVFGVSDRLDRQYLLHYLKSDMMLSFIKEYATGSVRDNLKLADLGKLPINLRPVEEQRQIATTLDKIDDLIAKRRQQLDKLDELVKSRFIEMFGNFVYERDRWNVCTIGDVADTIDPQPSHRTPPISLDGIPYVGIAECNYSTRRIDFEKARKVGQNVLREHTERYTLDEGDFIIGKIGTIGKPFFIPIEQTYTLSANTVLIKPIKGKVVSQYLYAVFQSEYMDRIIDAEKKSTSQPAFGIQKVRRIEIPMPPLELQQQFAAFVAQTDKSKLAIQKSLDKLEILKKALMQKYFG